MLDGIFNHPPKRNNEDLESDEEDDDTEANASERIKETECLENVSEINVNAPNPNISITNHEVIFSGDENTNITSEAKETLPSIPTTFGSENITSLRLLRKSLNLSRNNSVDSNITPKNGQIEKHNKIRIEARIDSDKRVENSDKNSNEGRIKTKKGVRYNVRSANININDESNNDLSSNTKAREPEIIEKILSPSKMKSVSKNTTPLQDSCDIEPSCRIIEENILPQAEIHDTMAHSKEISTEHLNTTNDKVTIKTNTKLTIKFVLMFFRMMHQKRFQSHPQLKHQKSFTKRHVYDPMHLCNMSVAKHFEMFQNKMAK